MQSPHPSFVVAVLFATATIRAQRTPDDQVDTNPPGMAVATFPDVAAAGDMVYATWVDRRLGRTDVFVRRSLERGLRWTEPDEQLNDPTFSILVTSPHVGAHGANVYVGWNELTFAPTAGQSVFVRRSTDGGATWPGTPVSISGSVRSSEIGAIVADGPRACIGWKRVSGECYVAATANQGAQWASQRLSPMGTTITSTPDLHVSGATVYATWSDNRNGAPDVWFHRSTDGGVTWPGSAIRINSSAAGATTAVFPVLAADGTDIVIAYTDDRNGLADVFVNRSTDGGTTWLPADVRISTDPPGAADAELVQIARHGAGVCATWEDNRNGARDVFANASTDGGASWRASDARLNTDGAGTAASELPVVCALAADTFVVAWHDTRNGPPDPYCNYTTNGGAAWGTSDVRLAQAAPGADAGRVRMTQNAAGVHVVWSDSRAGASPNVYVNAPFGFRAYGAATPGTGGLAPHLGASGVALLTENVDFEVTDALASASTGFLIGFGLSSQVQIPVLGGELLVDPILPAPVRTTSGSGEATLQLPLPMNPVFQGFNVNVQAVIFDPGAPQGISMTNAVAMWIG